MVRNTFGICVSNIHVDCDFVYFWFQFWKWKWTFFIELFCYPTFERSPFELCMNTLTHTHIHTFTVHNGLIGHTLLLPVFLYVIRIPKIRCYMQYMNEFYNTSQKYYNHMLLDQTFCWHFDIGYIKSYLPVAKFMIHQSNENK